MADTPLRLMRHGRTGGITLRHDRLGDIWRTTLGTGENAALDGYVLSITGPGKVAIEGTARLGPGARPVRLRLARGRQVLQTGIGNPDTALNDALCDPRTDVGLRFEARGVRVTRCGRGLFHVVLQRSRRVRVVLEPDHFHKLCPHLRRGGLQPKPPAPGGWLSYYCHFERPTEQAILDDLAVAGGLVDHGMSFFLIEAWQRHANRQPCKEFYSESRCDRAKFPHGMKWMADRIRAQGLRPGLWTIPLGTGNPTVYRASPRMFLHDAEGRPLSDWSGLYMFDPTHPAARAHIREQLRTMVEDWGYEFLKLDGLSGRDDHYGEWFYAQPEVRRAFSRPMAEPFRTTIQLIRRALGTRTFFHACAAFYHGASAGIPDGARAGGDVFYCGQSPSWHSVRAAAKVVLESLFTNRYLWHADPDVLCVRRPLSVGEAQAWASLFGLTGIFMASSDKLSKLPRSRLDILKRVLPPADIYPLDLQPRQDLPPVWNLAIRKPFGHWNVVGLFNWDGSAAEQTIRFAELGLDGNAKPKAFV